MYKVNINLTVDNPYQPPDRHAGAEHQRYIQEELCPKILQHAYSRPETLGLLQLPAGRIVDAHQDPVPRETLEPELPFDGELTSWLRERDYKVQLAWGHGRRDAFAWLGSRRDGNYQVMPLEIVYFTDEEMATSAWTENQARSDLTPLQRLFMLERMMQDFEWNQTEIARQLNLSTPVISNTLRLRKLEKMPAVQEALEARQISERQAVALLPLAEMPVELLNKKQSSWISNPSKLVEQAVSGVSSDELRKNLADLVKWSAKELDPVEFNPAEDYFDAALLFLNDEKALRNAECTGCMARFTYDKKDYCADEGCWKVKRSLHQQVSLTRASEASRILVKDVNTEYIRQHFYTQPYDRMLHPDEASGTQGILAEGCENLRIYYDRDPRAGEALDLERFPLVAVGCLAKDGCVCAARMRDQIEKTDPEQLSEFQDKQNEHNEWQLKREKLARLVDPVEEVLAHEFEKHNPKVWTRHFHRETLEEVWEHLANQMMSRMMGWHAEDDLEQARGTLVQLCKLVGVDPDVVPPLDGGELDDEPEEEETAPGELVEEDPDPLGRLQTRYQRITSWITETNGDATTEQIRGNITNLQQIKAELVELNGEDGRIAEALRHLVADTIDQLQMMQGG